MDVIRVVTAALLVTLATTCYAGLYKWVDENGQLHYSDTPVRGKAGKPSPKVQEVNIHDGYAIKDVTKRFPIRLNDHQLSSLRGVTFSDFHVRLPVSEGHRINIGRQSQGTNCRVAAILYWYKQDMPLDDEAMSTLVDETFSHYHYRYSSSASAPLVLSGAITSLKVDSCNVYGDRSRDAAYVKVSWKLKEAYNDEIVYRGTTEGSMDKRGYSARKKGLSTTIGEAVKVSIINLLSDKKFVSAVTKKPEFSEQDTASASSAPVLVHYTKHRGDFRTQVKRLEELAVTVKTENGHGSGVLMDSHGHVLTNAHVINGSQHVTVRVGNNDFAAKVLKKDIRRDVALVKITEESLLPKNIELNPVTHDVIPGDEVYVIGTPLDLSLNETITKGIISAKRNIDGLSYLQTDAAVNPGNSGGPAFNAKGELVAIAVAGLVNADGASVNINYLIPIQDAMKSLNIIAME